MLLFQEGNKRQLREASAHPPSSERYVHTFRDLSNFSGTINVTYRYLAGTPLNRKSEFSLFFKAVLINLLIIWDQELKPRKLHLQSDAKMLEK